MENILEIKNLRKSYKDFNLNNVGFELPRGYIMGLIGPNGAGKTTIIKLIMNLIRRDNGSISVFGKDVIGAEAEVKSNIGFVYDTPKFHIDIRLRDIAAATAMFYKEWDNNRFNELITEFNLDLKAKPRKLSHGQKTRFALAMGLSHNADLLILDEPAAGLDPVFRSRLMTILQEYIQGGEKSILLSSHIISDLEKIADYITFINYGEIVFSQSREQINDTWKIIKGNNKYLNTETRKMMRGLRENEFQFEGITDKIDKFNKDFLKSVTVVNADLEQILVFLSKQEELCM